MRFQKFRYSSPALNHPPKPIQQPRIFLWTQPIQNYCVGFQIFCELRADLFEDLTDLKGHREPTRHPGTFLVTQQFQPWPRLIWLVAHLIARAQLRDDPPRTSSKTAHESAFLPEAGTGCRSQVEPNRPKLPESHSVGGSRNRPGVLGLVLLGSRIHPQQ